MTETSAKASLRAWYAVGLLGLLYVVAFVDRIVLALLIEPLKAEFGVSDTQISLLIGFNFALFYALVGLPMGRLADRINRRTLIVASTAVWAACTLLSGFATAFWMLGVLRIGVAIGEAALSPSAISMIGDLFPKKDRGRATSIYMAMGAAGATGGYIVGGYMVGLIGETGGIVIPGIGAFKAWQTVFLAVSLPAVVLGVLLWLTVREPTRRTVDGVALQPSAPWEWLKKTWRPMLLLFVAGSVGQTMVHGLLTWAPSFMVRDFGWMVGRAGMTIGVATLIGGVGGMVLWPMITERWSRTREDALPLILTFGVVTGGVAMIVAATASGAATFIAGYGVAMFALMGTGVLLMIAIQQFANANMRGEMMALCLLLTALIAQGIGPTFVPMASKLLDPANADIRMGYIALALVATPIAALFALWARAGLLRLKRENPVD